MAASSGTEMEVKATESSLWESGDRWGCKNVKVLGVDQPYELQTFRLPNVSKVNPQGSFKCAQQADSSSGASKLDGLGLIQTRSTLRAPSNSSLVTRECLTQAEEDSRNRSAKLVKPKGPVLGRRPARKRAPGAIPDVVPIKKRSTPTNLALLLRKPKEQSTVYHRSYRDRVIHLLALRSYKKPELLSRLYKDGIHKKDKNSLGIILKEVAKLNTKDNSYVLKDYLYKEIRKDWPGYSEVDKQSLELILSRKSESSQNATSSSNVHPPVTLNKGAPSDASQKQPENLRFYKLPISKKQRISRVANGAQLRGQMLASCEKVTTTHTLLYSHPAPPTSLLRSATLCPTFSLLEMDVNSPSTPEGQGMQAPLVGILSLNSSSVSGDQQQKQTPLSVKPPKSMNKKPPKLHQKPEGVEDVKEKDTVKMQDTTVSASGNEKGLRKQETDKQGETSSLDSLEGVQETCTVSKNAPSSPSEQPDYFQKYVTIASDEQCQRYIDDFNAEYDEYRKLHAWIESVIWEFRQLGEQWQVVSPESKEYQVLHDKIIDMYQNIKSKSNPSYDEEKRRCEYLHNKLSHIKSLINKFHGE